MHAQHGRGGCREGTAKGAVFLAREEVRLLVLHLHAHYGTWPIYEWRGIGEVRRGLVWVPLGRFFSAVFSGIFFGQGCAANTRALISSLAILQDPFQSGKKGCEDFESFCREVRERVAFGGCSAFVNTSRPVSPPTPADFRVRVPTERGTPGKQVVVG